jgi:hypothetical protein
MSSQRQIAANRSNARKSRGPRTAAGKSCASRNALRHGLAAITRLNPALAPDIERMAKTICANDQNPLLFEQALMIAENETVLLCVRAERVAVIERLRDGTASPLARKDDSLARAKARFRLAKLGYEGRVQAKDKNKDTNKDTNKANKVAGDNGKEQDGKARDLAQKRQGAPAQPAVKPQPMKLRDEFDAMCLAMPDLDRLERYERRAWSRRERAMRHFTQIKSRGGG